MPGYSPGGNITSRPLIYGQPNQGGVYQSNVIGVQGINKGPGFAFQKRNQRVDWRKLASVDVERVARDVDVAALQDNILNVAFCDIQSEMDVRGVDYNFLKLFLLAQLMIEYLLHSQEYLQSYIAESEGKVQEIIQGQDNIRAEVEKKSEAYRNLKKEYHKTKKLLGEYQLMVRAGASGAHRCPYCSKSFMSDEFLRSHIERRHAETTPSKPGVASLPEHEKTQLLEEIQKISVRLQTTEAKLQTEAEERNKLILEQRETDMEQIRKAEREQRLWKEQEELRMKAEMEKYKDMIMQELKDVHSQKEAAEMALKDLQRQYGTKKTMIGDLEDVDGGPEKRIQVLKDDFSGQIQGLKESYQEELQRLERKFRNREERAKTEYEAELHKSRVLLEKYENTLNEQKKSSGKTDLEQKEKMVNLVEKVKDLERIVGEQKSKQSTPALTLSQLDKTPPAPPPRSPQTADQRLKSPSDRGDVDTNDLIAFWVSSLNNQNFRVWKSSSSSKSDWKDVFSFSACAKPVGNFDFPVYVYSAGGSPYWRQYVSSQPNPPRSHYKQDFVFYVSRSELLGTTRVHVLDSGSGAVIKSMMSRNSQVEGWKSKGLSFYVLKPKAGGGKFVSFTSTLEETESGDDVSVSSFTATDEAKKNLAEVLKRSREDLVKAVGENLEGDEDLDSEEEDEDLDRDEADGDHLAQSTSTSLWGSTLLETGTYRPFKNNPLAVAQYNHSAETIEVCRNEAMESLDHILSNYGVDPDATRMPMRQYQAKMKIHENRVKQLALEKEDFLSKRRKVESSLNDLVEERFNVRNVKNEDLEPSSSAPSKRKPTFRTAATAVRSATKLSRPPDTNSPGASQTMSSTGSYEQLSTNEDFGRAQHSPRQPIRSAVESFPQASRGKPSNRLTRAEEISETPYGNNDLSESEGWDSEQMSEEEYSPSPTAQLPRVTVSKPALSSQTPTMKQRAPRGEKVRELAASLEASLSSRDSTKKLAGAVDLHRQEHMPDEPAQRRKGPLKSSPIKDDFDDGSDFSLSSLEDRGNQSRNTGKRDEESDLEASVEDALRGVLRSRPGPQGGRPSASPTPVRTISSQRHASKVSMVDDFDDDSDLELQHIP